MMDLDRVNNYLARVEESEKTTFKPVGSRLKVGVDLGTAYIVLVVLDEENNPVACEKQAAQVLRDGVVVDYTGALRIVRSLKEKLEARLGTELVNCAIAMPAGTESSVKTHQYVAEGAGLEVTNILDEPSAANAIYQIEDGVVVDIGGGTTEVAVISLGGIVTSSSLRLAGNRMDEAIAMHLRDLLGIKVGERTAEIIKIKIGSILPFEDGREKDMIISGQDVVTEQPREVTIQSEDVRAALQPPIEEMVVHIKETFKKTNPDLASDIISNGILLTGGGGLLSGLDRFLTQRLEIPVWTSETALTNVAMGCLKVLETPSALKQTLMRSK